MSLLTRVPITEGTRLFQPAASAQSQAQQEGPLVSPLGSSSISGEVLNLTPWLHRSQTIQGPW